jgi:hypothetical protein
MGKPTALAERTDSRSRAWQAPARPDWVRIANEKVGAADLRAIVPLDPESLIAAAKAQTGLDHFGADDGWREALDVTCRSLDEESDLHFLGRVLTRADMIATLSARLMVEDAYRRHPAIEDETIEAPLLIVGQGRTCTSALLNLLDADPDNAVVHASEILFPRVEAGAEQIAADRARANEHFSLWNEVAPPLWSMHEFTGDIPTESIHAQSLTFQAPAWQVLFGQMPSLYAHVGARSRVSAIAYEKRVLKLLQWRKPRRRWVLKSPDALNYLPDVLAVFPDVGLVWTHRDPLKALSSAVSLVSTIAWARSDTPLAAGVAEAVTDLNACAAMLEGPIDLIESGAIPHERIVHMGYNDFVADPLREVRRIYDHFAMPLAPASERAMAAWLAAHPREQRPSHRYAGGAEEDRSQERRILHRYQDYFAVASET